MDIEIDLETAKEMAHSLISDLKNTFPETKGVPDRWKLGLSDEKMTDIAKHHLGLTNFKGVILKDHIPVFTQYVTEAAPYEQSTVLINTAPDSEPGKHWVALHYQPPTGYRACEDRCLVEYFDSYRVANLLPEINIFIEEVSPFNPVGYNFVNLQDFSDDQSTACGNHCLCFAYVKHSKPDLCVTDFYKAYPQNGHDQHKNELYVINFMDQTCV